MAAKKTIFSSKSEAQIMSVLAKFVRVARHIRNYPHADLPINLLRKEATLAEMEAEYLIGRQKFAELEKLAFPETHG